MYDTLNESNAIGAILLGKVTFWPPALARRLGGIIRQTATLAIAAVSLVGIAIGFVGASDQDDTMLQSVLMFAGLIG